MFQTKIVYEGENLVQMWKQLKDQAFADYCHDQYDKTGLRVIRSVVTELNRKTVITVWKDKQSFENFCNDPAVKSRRELRKQLLQDYQIVVRKEKKDLTDLEQMFV